MLRFCLVRTSLSCFLLILALAIPAEARGLSFLRTCAEEFGRFAGLEPRASLAEVMGPEELARPVRRWLTLQQEFIARSRQMHHKIGDSVSVAGTSTKILAVLGKGGEGEVFLVRTPSGLRTLKAFERLDAMKKNLAEMQGSFPMAQPKVIQRDFERKFVLLEYVEGANVEQVLSRGRNMGLTKIEIDRILSKWRIEQDRIRSQREFPPEDRDVIYSFKEDRFFRVDPR